MSERGRKLDSNGSADRELAQMLALELVRSRGRWNRIRDHRGIFLIGSLCFLALVIAGACVAFYLLFSAGDLAAHRKSETGRSYEQRKP